MNIEQGYAILGVKNKAKNLKKNYRPSVVVDR
jgi:hypothetical protein